MRNLVGVKGVANSADLKSPVSQAAVKSDIEAALKRSAQLDAQSTGVQADGHSVIVTGSVQSYAETREAERAAWAAPGVYSVDNRISIHV